LVSSKDVAKHAGVSQTTVSRVLNTPEIVKKRTIDKVTQAINDLNYIPNAHARSLVQNKTNTIALLSGPLQNPFFVDTTSSIVNYANEKGYRINVIFVNDQNLSEAYANTIANKVDGIILSCILLDDPIFNRLKQMDIPFITYNRKHRSNEYFVEIDNFQAGYLAAKHLIELGHQFIGWIGGPLSFSTFNNRYQGFLKAIEDNQLPLSKQYFINTDTSKKNILNAFHALMRLKQRPTAICGGSDSLALNLIDCATQENFIIPEDLSIMGIDNVDISNHGLIKLTTVGSTCEQNLGYLAICKLIEMIENKKNCCIKITKSVKILERSTTRKI
jgi:DNA-binding LacI/PurR family transcriptional regulator